MVLLPGCMIYHSIINTDQQKSYQKKQKAKPHVRTSLNKYGQNPSNNINTRSEDTHMNSDAAWEDVDLKWKDSSTMMQKLKKL